MYLTVDIFVMQKNTILQTESSATYNINYVANPSPDTMDQVGALLVGMHDLCHTTLQRNSKEGNVTQVEVVSNVASASSRRSRSWTEFRRQTEKGKKGSKDFKKSLLSTTTKK